ncbi:preprotein translocase subunit SecE [candidate division KSB1 bacterium]|nr:preprotein translocase subunit SecE [candidate division KSB1 bacterium]
MTNPVPALITFLKEARIEAKKVNWPTRERTIRDTIIVIVFSIAVAIFLGGFDLLFNALLDRYII